MEQFILAAALEGLEAQKALVELQIRNVSMALGMNAGKPKRERTKKVAPKSKRTITAAGRAAIKAAQVKRWAAYRKAQKKGKK